MGTTESIFYDEDEASERSNEEEEVEPSSLTMNPPVTPQVKPQLPRNATIRGQNRGASRAPPPPLFRMVGLILGLPKSGKQSLMHRLMGKDPFSTGCQRVLSTAVPYQAPRESQVWDRIQLQVNIIGNRDDNQRPYCDFSVLLVDPRHARDRIERYIFESVEHLLKIQGMEGSGNAEESSDKPFCLCLLVNFRDKTARSPKTMNVTESDIQQFTLLALQEHAPHLEPSRLLLQCGSASLFNCFGLGSLHFFIYQTYLMQKQWQLQSRLRCVSASLSRSRNTGPPNIPYVDYIRQLQNPSKLNAVSRNEESFDDSSATNNHRRSIIISEKQRESELPKNDESSRRALEAFLANDDDDSDEGKGQVLDSDDDDDSDKVVSWQQNPTKDNELAASTRSESDDSRTTPKKAEETIGEQPETDSSSKIVDASTENVDSQVTGASVKSSPELSPPSEPYSDQTSESILAAEKADSMNEWPDGSNDEGMKGEFRSNDEGQCSTDLTEESDGVHCGDADKEEDTDTVKGKKGAAASDEQETNGKDVEGYRPESDMRKIHTVIGQHEIKNGSMDSATSAADDSAAKEEPPALRSRIVDDDEDEEEFFVDSPGKVPSEGLKDNGNSSRNHSNGNVATKALDSTSERPAKTQVGQQALPSAFSSAAMAAITAAQAEAQTMLQQQHSYPEQLHMDHDKRAKKEKKEKKKKDKKEKKEKRPKVPAPADAS